MVQSGIEKDKEIAFMLIGGLFTTVLLAISLNIKGCPSSENILLTANIIMIGVMLAIFFYGLKLYLKRK